MRALQQDGNACGLEASSVHCPREPSRGQSEASALSLLPGVSMLSPGISPVS